MYLEQAKVLNLFPYEYPEVFIGEKPIREHLKTINSSGWIFTCASCCGHMHRKRDDNPDNNNKWLNCPQLILAVHINNLQKILYTLDGLQSSLMKISHYKHGELMCSDFPASHHSWVYIDLVWHINNYRDIQKSRLEIQKIAEGIKRTNPE
jgi:hypothetical protein